MSKKTPGQVLFEIACPAMTWEKHQYVHATYERFAKHLLDSFKSSDLSKDEQTDDSCGVPVNDYS